MRTERYPATVTSNDDDLKRGRIKVKCLQLLGDTDTEHPRWIDPAFDWGWFFVPDVGEEVEVEMVVTDDQQEDTFGQAFLEAPNLRWRGKRFQADKGEAPRPPNTQLTEKNYGKRRGFATPTGHVLLFDDTEGDETVTLSWKRGSEEEYAFLSLDKDGSVQLSNTKGGCLYLNAAQGENALIDEHGNSFSSRADSMNIIDVFNNSLEMKQDVVTLLGGKDALVTAGSNVMVDAGSDVGLKAVQKIAAEAPDVRLGQTPTEFVMLATQLLLWVVEVNANMAKVATALNVAPPGTPVLSLGPPPGGLVIPHVAAPAAATQVKAK